MKKRVVLLLLVLSMFLIIPAYAATPRNAMNVPGLSYNGTTATCSALVIGSVGDEITAVITLWDGSTCVETWVEDAVYYLDFQDTVSVTRGRTYTLKVDATIDGVSQPTTSVSAKCS